MGDEIGFTKEAMPTQGGTYSAWLPEYLGPLDGLTPDGWRSVPMQRSAQGVPGSPFFDGINATIGMCSLAQANAIAWGYAAAIEAQTGKEVSVRVIEHRVRYDIKCYRAATPLPTHPQQEKS